MMLTWGAAVCTALVRLSDTLLQPSMYTLPRERKAGSRAAPKSVTPLHTSPDQQSGAHCMCGLCGPKSG